MGRADAPRGRLPRGVTALPRPRGGRGFRASIRRGKAGEVHLGLYETAWLAGFAHDVAAKAIGRGGGREADIPRGQAPTAEEVREITAKVRRRLGLDPPGRPDLEQAPTAEDWLTFFEITAVGFWRIQAAEGAWDHPDASLDAAAGRLVDAARLVFWRRGKGDPDPLGVMTRLLGRRLDASFRRSDVAREVLDDDGDDPSRVARWLVHPDAFPAGLARGFREEIRHLYPDVFGESPGSDGPDWAAVLGLEPPYTLGRIRSAYLARCREAHPDVGGSAAAFVRLQAAYDEARAHASARGG